jgi:hypothetical protein
MPREIQRISELGSRFIDDEPFRTIGKKRVNWKMYGGDPPKTVAPRPGGTKLY